MDAAELTSAAEQTSAAELVGAALAPEIVRSADTADLVSALGVSPCLVDGVPLHPYFPVAKRPLPASAKRDSPAADQRRQRRRRYAAQLPTEAWQPQTTLLTGATNIV